MAKCHAQPTHTTTERNQGKKVTFVYGICGAQVSVQ